MRLAAVLITTFIVTALAGNRISATEQSTSTDDVLRPVAGHPANETDTVWEAYVDGYYGHNFNRPPRRVVGTNPESENRYRIFDTKDDGITLSLLEINLTQKPKPLGFRADLNFGETPKYVNMAEPQNSAFWEHMQQLYFTYDFNGGSGRNTLDFGKFVTNSGAEVIESRLNWNYTRGILFGWAIPFYHAGFRFTHRINDTRWWGLSVTNGWNNVRDNNGAKTYGLSYNAPLGNGSLLVNYYGGDEPTVVSKKEWRNLVDVIWALSPEGSKWSYMLNADWASQDNASSAGDATWYGLAGYAKYSLSNTTNWAARLESFRDKNGFSTGTSQTLGSATLTFDYHPGSKWIHRLELRHDWTNKNTFEDHTGAQTRNSMTTLTLGSVYKF